MIPFQYNEYSSLLLVVVVPAMLYAGLLLYRGWKNETVSVQIVGALVFVFALQCTAWMLGFAGYYDQSAKTIFMFYCPWRQAYLYGPLVYLFFRSLTDRNFQLWKSPNCFHLIPGLIFIAYQIATIAYDFLVVQVHTLDVQPNDLSDVPGLMLNSTPDWLFMPLAILELLSQLGYFTYTLILYRRYRSYLQTAFSNDELVHLRWLRNFLVFFLMLVIGTNVIDLLSDSIEGLTTYEVNWYGFLLYGLIACYLGFQAYDNNPEAYRKIDFQEFTPELGTTEEIRRTARSSKAEVMADNISLPAEANKDYAATFSAIEATLVRQQLYLEPTLSLQELADAVKLSATEVSNAINREANTNFNYYINTKRVQAVKEKLLDPDFGHLSLLGIGLDAGFSSKATFNRAFKLHTGMTPRQFQKSQIPEQVVNT